MGACLENSKLTRHLFRIKKIKKLIYIKFRKSVHERLIESYYYTVVKPNYVIYLTLTVIRVLYFDCFLSIIRSSISPWLPVIEEIWNSPLNYSLERG